ncbi:acyltransferase family protein [Arcticibacter sp. MXS-1]|uniref:acyltransferase family protein n=1 Tax=Arcticibacter sp. MXS-1 TaxID=3341726 RepID=UPI0035A8D9CF
MPSLSKSRVESLDWLRGLVALSIMFYHLSYWCFQQKDASSVLGRLGIYGVSIFFVLSGLSVAIAYHHYVKDMKTILRFLVRRLFRIWPLLWIATTLTAVAFFVKTRVFSWELFLINITTLFGFFDPDACIATGAWSIGNEMVYYVLTPFIFALYNYKRWAGNISFVLSLSIGALFAFYFLDPRIPLARQWSVYINPFNNFFLYVSGIAMYYNFRNVRINPKISSTLLLAACVLFSLLPFGGDQISIVTGLGRIVFVALVVIIVLCFYKSELNLAEFISRPLSILGEATYGIYMLHPVAYIFIHFALAKVHIDNPYLAFSLVIILSVVVAILSFRLFEQKMIKLGKNVTRSAQSKDLDVKLSNI